ncbi:MAG: sensor histidine kinase [Bacteroidales bacterium]
MKELNEYTATELLQMVKQRDLLIAALSHDLINSFNSILFFSKKLADDIELTEKQKKSATIIATSAERAYLTLENLTPWTKLRINYTGEKQLIIRLSEMMSTIIDSYKYEIGNKSLIVNTAIDNHLSFCANPEELFSILRNMISNAIKFSNPGGVIQISNLLKDETVSISITDQGIGIPPERLGSIFMPIELKKQVGTSGEKGFGFGLMLVKELVEANGGEVSCNSEVDKGTTFVVSFQKK